MSKMDVYSKFGFGNPQQAQAYNNNLQQSQASKSFAKEITNTLYDTSKSNGEEVYFNPKTTDTQKYSILKKARAAGLIDQAGQLELINSIGQYHNSKVEEEFSSGMNPFEKAAMWTADVGKGIVGSGQRILGTASQGVDSAFALANLLAGDKKKAQQWIDRARGFTDAKAVDGGSQSFMTQGDISGTSTPAQFATGFIKAGADTAMFIQPELKVGSTAAKIGSEVGINAATTGIASAADQYTRTGKIDPLQTAKDAVVGGATAGTIRGLREIGVKGKINPTKLEVALKDAEVKPPKVTKIEVKTSKAEVKKPVSAPVEPKQIKTRTIRTADGKTEYVAQIGNSVTDRVGRETGFKASSTSPNFSSEGEMNKWIKKQTDASTPQPTAPKVEAPQVGKTVTLDKDVTLYHGSRDKIDTFDLNHLNATYMHDGLGINFTDSKDFAKLYSRGKNQWGEINKFDDGKGFINEKTIPKGTKVLDVSDKSRKVSDILSIDDFKSLAKKGRDKEFARENLERNARNILTGRDDSSLVIAKKVSSMSDDELLDVAYNRLKDRTFANGEGLPDVFRQLIDVYGIKTDDIADVTRQFSKQTGIDVIKTKKADGSSVYTVLNPDKLNAKPTVVPQVTKTPVAETKPVAPTEGTAGRVYERMKAEHPEIYTDATSKESITLKQEADTAVSMIAQDKQKVFDIAMQAEASPEVTSTAANIALVDQALKEGNVELANRLTRARSIAQKRRGQEISAERLTTDNSRQRYMDELLSMKLNKYGERYLGDLETKVKKSTPSKRALAKLDSEVARMETRIKSKKLTVDDAIGLLEKMACI